METIFTLPLSWLALVQLLVEVLLLRCAFPCAAPARSSAELRRSITTTVLALQRAASCNSARRNPRTCPSTWDSFCCSAEQSVPSHQCLCIQKAATPWLQVLSTCIVFG